MISNEEEVLDLVDINDKVVGNITHDQVFDWANLSGNYLRASDAYIMNSQGKLWVPRRTAHKKIAPNGLDFSMGEHVMSGETYLDAAVRGFAEELQMSISADQLEFLGTLPPKTGAAPYFSANFILRSDEEPDYNTDDFVGAEWLTPLELKQRMQQGELGKSSIVYFVDQLLAYEAEHASH